MIGMLLLETTYGRIDWDPTRTLVRFTRSDLPYRSSEDIEAEASAIDRVLRDFGPHCPLLVDLRAVTPRNDPAFEKAIVKLRRSLFGAASRIAILVRTAVGVLQTKRHAFEDGVVAGVFHDEALALAYLAMREAPLRSRPAAAWRGESRTRSESYATGRR